MPREDFGENGVNREGGARKAVERPSAQTQPLRLRTQAQVNLVMTGRMPRGE
jgi:hypothetical protein